MITAIVNQRICKRQREAPLPRPTFKNIRINKNIRLLPSFQEEEPKGKQRIQKTLSIAQYGIILCLLLICSLLLLAVKTESFPLPPRDYSEYEIRLPEDMFLEEDLFAYTVSGNVRTDPDDAENMDAAVVESLRIIHHTVRRGENLSVIAQRYKLNLDTIISYNNIKNAKTIIAGTKLDIPSINGLKYHVRRGDNLSNIAGRFNISLNTLLDWNNIASEVILPGTEYFIPGARLSKNALNRALGILFVYPVRGRLSSRFGWRPDPFTGKRTFHNGIDLVNTENTPIMAAMDGQVVKTSFNKVYGRYVIIKHSDGFQTLYGHLNAVKIKERQKVSQGQIIALMGNTGRSTGTHLHFAIFRNGEPVNPYQYL